MASIIYRIPADSPNLQQGDLISRSPQILDLLERVHKHFCQDKYLAFMVVTQTCDLVQRRGEDCKAEYIELAAIRSLNGLIVKVLNRECGSGIEGVLVSENKGRARDLLSRILNQNEQTLGLFYLHPDADAGIAEPAVALLRVTIAVRAEHYPLLLTSRIGSLSELFSSKLGWLCGNLYARVATPDLTDVAKADCDRIMNDLLSDKGHDLFRWAQKKAIERAKKANVLTSEMSLEERLKIIRQNAPKAPKELALAAVRSVAAGVLGEGSEKAIDKIVGRLAQDQQFMSCFVG